MQRQVEEAKIGYDVMVTEELKRYLESSPFQPFKIVSADGHEVEVPHPDYVSIGPGGRTAVIWMVNGGFAIFDLALVTRLEFALPK